MEKLLTRLGLDNAIHLGSGAESDVYMLDACRVLRVMKDKGREALERRTKLLAILNACPLPYAVPDILDIGEVESRVYSVEKRLPGTVLRSVLPSLEAMERRKALRSFVEAVDPLVAIPVDSLPYGELIDERAIRANSWPHYLHLRVQSALAKSWERLSQDVPDLGACLADFEQRLAKLGEALSKTLVHGDFYPANVMVGTDLSITSVLDFSSLTIVGDPDIDRAEALSSVEDQMRDGIPGTEAEWFRTQLRARHGDNSLEKLRTYQTYYALLFSDCWQADPVTYGWCLRILRSWRAHRNV